MIILETIIKIILYNNQNQTFKISNIFWIISIYNIINFIYIYLLHENLLTIFIILI
jgi:hypothetical protein